MKRRSCTSRKYAPPWADDEPVEHENLEVAKRPGTGEIVYHCKDCGDYSSPEHVDQEDIECFLEMNDG